eukprot:scaffold110810_cov19-Prasinocladus_malaysianus.AAC.1
MQQANNPNYTFSLTLQNTFNYSQARSCSCGPVYRTRTIPRPAAALAGRLYEYSSQTHYEVLVRIAYAWDGHDYMSTCTRTRTSDVVGVVGVSRR